MVYSRAQQEGMEMGPERSKPLHNFTLPCSLKWGNQRHLRCIKVDDSSTTTTTVDHHQHHQRHHRQRRSPPSKLGIKTNNNNNNNNSSGSIITTRRQLKILKEGHNDVGGGGGEEEEEEEEEEGIEAVREKIMMDLKTAADKMKDMILREEEEEQVSGEERERERGKEKEREGSPTEEARPWNLRTRRAACKAPIGGGSGSNKGVLRIDERKVSSSSPMRTEKLKEKERPPKFAVALTKKEIDEDFMAMTGHRPPRRPKKRPRNVQKQLDTLFPGLWLTGITADSYKVEFPENGKR